MIKHSLDADAFIERAGNYNVTTDPWPFADIVPDQHHKHATELGYGADKQDGIAVGKLVSAYAGIAEFHLPDSTLFGPDGQRIQFAYGNEHLDQAFQAMVGVPMALDVSIDTNPKVNRPQRLTQPFHLQRVLAITPPLADSAHAHTSPLLAYRGEYAQGTVSEHLYPHAATSSLRLATVGVAEVVNLRRYEHLRVRTPDGKETHGSPMPGDVVRVEVTCDNYLPREFNPYHAGNIAYLLTQSAQTS
jgi:hypothetical protein